MSKISDIQFILGVPQDDKWGPKTQAALDAVIHPVTTNTSHEVKASSFADPSDVKAYERCIASGKTPRQCYAVGDNGEGCWGDSTKEGSGASCALPPEDIIARWGSMANGRNKGVMVSANNRSIYCVLKDCMPHKANIRNGAGIDLNPDAVRELGLEPPIMVAATWRWA